MRDVIVDRNGAYATPEESMNAIIPIIHAEIESMLELGVDSIQIDNP